MTKTEYFAALTTLTLCAGSLGATGLRMRSTQESGKADRQVIENTFYCNSNALTAEERAHHKQLGDKLTRVRKALVETEKGYEFQFSPSDVTIADLADWVTAESKCCPFFDFHVDLENQGKLICLRLTGVPGIKQFIRAEFMLP